MWKRKPLDMFVSNDFFFSSRKHVGSSPRDENVVAVIVVVVVVVDCRLPICFIRPLFPSYFISLKQHSAVSSEQERREHLFRDLLSLYAHRIIKSFYADLHQGPSRAAATEM